MPAPVIAALTLLLLMAAPMPPAPAPRAPAAPAPAPAAPLADPAPAGTLRAKGTFEVKLTPEGDPEKAAGVTFGRASAVKQFHGDLEGSSTGTMLTAVTDVKDSAGYVAIERVTGTLNGRRGTFVLQHSATMTRGTPQLSIVVVPDSGTDELKGLAGRMTITITEGQHKYDFEYMIAAAN